MHPSSGGGQRSGGQKARPNDPRSKDRHVSRGFKMTSAITTTVWAIQDRSLELNSNASKFKPPFYKLATRKRNVIGTQPEVKTISHDFDQ
jgi:hypothetical protein